MVMSFSPSELTDLRDAQQTHMMDTCLICEPTSTNDTYNLPAHTFDWDEAEESPCGLNASPSKELLSQVPNSEAVLRLPIGTTISNLARTRITKRFGETQSSPITYEVIGMPRLGPSGMLVWLKKVTDGSDG
jgi:hypothetical protein